MANSSDWLVGGKLLAVLLLVFANGFFVAAEFALVSVRRSRIEQLVTEGHIHAHKLQRAVVQLNTYLAATQLGVTMSSLGLGWLGEPAVAAVLEPMLKMVLPETLSVIGAHTVSVAIAFTLITALHIVLGELAPKSLPLQRPEGTALAVVTLLEVYLAIFRPAIYLLNSLGNLILRLGGLQTGSSAELIHSPEELRFLVSASRKAGLLGAAEEDVVRRVFRSSEQRVSAFMTPRREIMWLDINDPLPKLQQQITNSAHSYLLICEAGIDHLLGIVKAKDLLAASHIKPLTVTNLMALLLSPLHIPESIRVLNVLKLFKESSRSIAIVVDEYGAIQGLVTLHDVLEALVGDIHTEGELVKPLAMQRQDGSWLLDGLLSIEEFKDLFNLRELTEGEGVEYLTVGGFVLKELGYIPTIAESFTWQHLQFTIMTMDGHRIGQIAVVSAQLNSVNSAPIAAVPDDSGEQL